jgi:hypothetical protein
VRQPFRRSWTLEQCLRPRRPRAEVALSAAQCDATACCRIGRGGRPNRPACELCDRSDQLASRAPRCSMARPSVEARGFDAPRCSTIDRIGFNPPDCPLGNHCLAERHGKTAFHFARVIGWGQHLVHARFSRPEASLRNPQTSWHPENREGRHTSSSRLAGRFLNGTSQVIWPCANAACACRAARSARSGPVVPPNRPRL